MPPSIPMCALSSVLVGLLLVRFLRRQKNHPPTRAIIRTVAIAIPAIAPPPSSELPLPLSCDAAVGSLPSDDCDVDALSLLSVVEASNSEASDPEAGDPEADDPVVKLGGISEPICEEDVTPSDGKITD